MNLREILVRPVRPSEEQRYQELMLEHHYLGSLPKISETLWYVAHWGDQWVALVSFSASALKCAARDRWIGWNLRHQYARLKLIVNNSRFLILPDWHIPNLGSRILSLCQRRLDTDWQKAFGHPVVLLETFVDPQRFQGTVYKATNWLYMGKSKGFRRTRHGHTATASSPKMVFLKPLRADARALLGRSRIRTGYGPENITRMRRFAIGVIKSKKVRSVSQIMRELTRNVRLVLDYLRMTANSCHAYA